MENVKANVAEMDNETLGRLFERYNEARHAWPEGSPERRRLWQMQMVIGREMIARH